MANDISDLSASYIYIYIYELVLNGGIGIKGTPLTRGSVTPLDCTNMTRWTNLIQPSRTPTGPESHKLRIFDFMASILFHVA